jgi:hypothetical protein
LTWINPAPRAAAVGGPPKPTFGRFKLTKTVGFSVHSEAVRSSRRRFPMRQPRHRSSLPLPADAAPYGGQRRRALLGLAIVPLALSMAPRPARAQVVRPFPDSARLGRLEMRVFPEAVLNDEPVRLAAGARIHDADNRIVMPSTLSGAFDVLVERDPSGQVGRVWILTPAELAAAQERERARSAGGGAAR